MGYLPEKAALHSHCNVPNRTVFCHDNLEVLQGINSGCIDLVYLDPPFNKKKVFTAPIGTSAKGASFKDIFTQEDIKDEWVQTIAEDRDNIYHLLKAVRNIEGRTSYNFCYLCYMAIRLIECHRVLKEAGGLYLHCDPTMSHYLKLLLDCIFDESNFRNEIVWGYRGGGVSKKDFAKKHDLIFRYVKGGNFLFNMQYIPYSEASRKLVKARGGVSIDNKPRDLERGASMPDWWEDINSLQTWSPERTGYPTQKPLALLERIIKASSNEDDMVLDPFCGCATSCVAAEKLNRQWIGIDISSESRKLVEKRIKEEVYAEGLTKGNDGLLPTIPPSQNYPPERTDRGGDYVEKKYVYIISHPNFPQEYKVGIAANLNNRLNSYQTSDSVRQYKLEYSLFTSYYRETEAYIHTKYKNNHEWVNGKLEDIIRDIKQYRIDK